MPDEGPLEHYLTVSHEPEPDIPEPAPERESVIGRLLRRFRN